ncbi:Trihelix transcription factor GT-1 [Folsomia candida]|uniref:Trihelix transcription factor GT-1 n=1 Tax=Folsomia candida TaxID=158441 RepID=A0A226D580_FOLCA|nr:Trihelix transcription factor GT-1 [Folsomia candida]
MASSNFVCGICDDSFQDNREVTETPETAETLVNSKDKEDTSEKAKTNPRWTNEQSLALINVYGEMKEEFGGSKPKKQVWEKFAKALNLGFDWNQCQGRWKTMLQGRKLAENHNRTSGKDRKPYMFESELGRVLGKKRNVHPSHLLESSTVAANSSNTNKKSRCSRSTLNGLEDEDGQNDENKQKVKRKLPKKADMLNWLTDYKIDQILENQKTRELEERQHQEKMSIMLSLVDVLKYISNKK